MRGGPTRLCAVGDNVMWLSDALCEALGAFVSLIQAADLQDLVPSRILDGGGKQKELESGETIDPQSAEKDNVPAHTKETKLIQRLHLAGLSDNRARVVAPIFSKLFDETNFSSQQARLTAFVLLHRYLLASATSDNQEDSAIYAKALASLGARLSNEGRGMHKDGMVAAAATLILDKIQYDFTAIPRPFHVLEQWNRAGFISFDKHTLCVSALDCLPALSSVGLLFASDMHLAVLALLLNQQEDSERLYHRELIKQVVTCMDLVRAMLLDMEPLIAKNPLKEIDRLVDEFVVIRRIVVEDVLTNSLKSQVSHWKLLHGVEIVISPITNILTMYTLTGLEECVAACHKDINIVIMSEMNKISGN